MEPMATTSEWSEYMSERVSAEEDIMDLNLSVRTWSVLKRNGVNTVSELKALSVDDLMRMRNMGRMSINEIGKALDRPDLSI